MSSNVDIVHVLVRVTSTAVGTPSTLSAPSYRRPLEVQSPPRVYVMASVHGRPRGHGRSRGHGRPRGQSGVPRPPPVPPVPQLDPLLLGDSDEENELALVVDTGMASVKVRALKIACTHVHVHSNMYCVHLHVI